MTRSGCASTQPQLQRNGFMFGITEASAAISSIKTAADIAKGLSALKSEADVNIALIDIQRTLLDAQTAALADKSTIDSLGRRISELEDRIRGFESWEKERARYVLTASPLGAHTYDLRPNLADGEIPHRLCVACFNDRKKSVLHVKAKHSGGEIIYCPRCDKDLTLAPFENTIMTFSSERRWDGW